MAALAVGGRSVCTSSSLVGAPARRTCSTSYKLKLILCTRHHQRLSAFPSNSYLFPYYSPRPNGKSLSSRISKRPLSVVPHLTVSLEQIEQTYIMVKPDGVQRGLVGEIISRFEKKGFKLIGLKLFHCPKDLAEEHYQDKAKSFLPKLIDYITSGPVVCMAWEGAGVVGSARKHIGFKDPLQSRPGKIRGDLAVQTGRNVVHGSDSPENGKREIALWFKESEIVQWTPALEPWLRE